jgi:hypothetical protein
MSYIINKTNGQLLAIVQDASVDQRTDLTFVGRNYSGYGEIQNENFVKLLENFSNSFMFFPRLLRRDLIKGAG